MIGIRLPGLKSQLFLALFVLLLIAMGLVTVVVLIRQQHNGVQSVITTTKAMLGTFSEEILAKGGRLDSENRTLSIEHKGKETPDNVCIIWNYMGEVYEIPKPCTGAPKIEKYLDMQESSGQPTVALDGSVWAVFTYASKDLIVSAPLLEDGIQVGSIALSRSLMPLYAKLRQELQVVLAYLIVNAIIFSTIGLFRMAHLVLRPIEKLVGLAEKYRSEEGMGFLLGQSSGEFGILTNSLNEMLHRIEDDNKKLRTTVESLERANKELETNRQGMLRTEKLAAVGRLSAGLAHEIGNPLGIVQGYVDMLGRVDLSKEEKEQFADRANRELQRINALIRQLLDYARPALGDLAQISVHALIRDVMELLVTRKKSESVSFSISLDAEFDCIFAVEDQLRQVLLNCLINAIDAIESLQTPTGNISISTRNFDENQGSSFLDVIIADDGIGIPREQLEIVFDPFFTTKEPGKGTGLGLSVSHAIVEGLGGTMSVAKRDPVGTEMLIRLPVSSLNKA